MKYGFIRLCCASPHIELADCVNNANLIIDSAKKADSNGAYITVFPELSITGSTCGNLFLQDTLQKAAIDALELIAKKTVSLNTLLVIGLPLCAEGFLFNCAIVLFKGKILAAIPKSNIYNSPLYFEGRFSDAKKSENIKEIFISTKLGTVPFGCDILICAENKKEFVLSVKISDDITDLFSNSHAFGVSLIANPCANAEFAGTHIERRKKIENYSLCTSAACICTQAGKGESVQDVVFASKSFIAENGEIIAENEAFVSENLYADVDIELLYSLKNSYAHCLSSKIEKFRCIYITLPENKNKSLKRFISSSPFLPDAENKSNFCRKILDLQAHALSRRLEYVKCSNAVIGLSGGLDSSLAFIALLKAFDLCGLPKKNIHAITMPCFGTTDRTYKNALSLANKGKVTLKEINILEDVLLHFKNIEHDENMHDCVYENSQARERTQVLMDYANKVNGIVIGTGDLSELALGWCTYGGDHISMYGINSSIPKTLVREVVKWASSDEYFSEFSDVLTDILDTPVSPELLPPENGSISQKTEDLIGPYELHDFYLFYLLKYGFSPEKILYLADNSDFPYTHEFKLKWLRLFYKRFFSQQFKRSCMPSGASVLDLSLSPRTQWKMPDDVSMRMWIEEIDRIK